MLKRNKAPLAAVLLLLGFLFGAHPCFEGCLKLIYPRPYEALVLREAEEFELSPALVYAVMKCESGFDPEAVSRAKAMGLMQLTEKTFSWVGSLYPPENGVGPLDPEDNIHCGCALLRLLLGEFSGEAEALAAYNAGMGAVTEWLHDPACSEDGKTLQSIPYPETAAYVRRVQKTRDIYRRLYGDAGKT